MTDEGAANIFWAFQLIQARPDSSTSNGCVRPALRRPAAVTAARASASLMTAPRSQLKRRTPPRSCALALATPVPIRTISPPQFLRACTRQRHRARIPQASAGGNLRPAPPRSALIWLRNADVRRQLLRLRRADFACHLQRRERPLPLRSRVEPCLDIDGSRQHLGIGGRDRPDLRQVGACGQHVQKVRCGVLRSHGGPSLNLRILPTDVRGSSSMMCHCRGRACGVRFIKAQASSSSTLGGCDGDFATM